MGLYLWFEVVSPRKWHCCHHLDRILIIFLFRQKKKWRDYDSSEIPGYFLGLWVLSKTSLHYSWDPDFGGCNFVKNIFFLELLAMLHSWIISMLKKAFWEKWEMILWKAFSNTVHVLVQLKKCAINGITRSLLSWFYLFTRLITVTVKKVTTTPNLLKPWDAFSNIYNPVN